MTYNPRPAPETTDPAIFVPWLNEELKILSQSLNESIELELRGSKHEPTRPREGMIVHADGTTWNPGLGAGTYRRQNNLWIKIPDGAGDLGSLFGYGRVLGISGNTTLTRTQSGMFVESGATLTVTLPTCSGNAGVNFSFINVTGGTNLTIATSTGSESIAFPDSDFVTSKVLTVNQRMTIVCDGANWVVVAANFRGAFPQGNGMIWDSTSLRTVQQMSITADGSGLKLSGDAASPGNSKYYGTDSGGSKGFFDLPAGGGITLLSSASVGTGTTYSVTGLGGYKTFQVFLREVSHNNGASQNFGVALSGNNGSSYGTRMVPFSATSFTAATLVSGCFFVDRLDQTNNQIAILGSAFGGATIETGSIGPIDAMQFSWSAGNFDNGSIDIYGLK